MATLSLGLRAEFVSFFFRGTKVHAGAIHTFKIRVCR